MKSTLLYQKTPHKAAVWAGTWKCSVHTAAYVDTTVPSYVGLRICKNDACGQYLNRDRNGALNIAKNFSRIWQGLQAVRPQLLSDAAGQAGSDALELAVALD